MANGKGHRRGFGAPRKLPSGRWQARYTAPDGATHTAKTADGRALTFDTKGDAEAWLSLRHSEIVREEWRPPKAPTPITVTFAKYADRWLANRQLATRTRDLYRGLLNNRLIPVFGDLPVTAITPAMVGDWNARQDPAKRTAAAHAYALLRTILGTAVSEDVIPANPCRVRGAGTVKTTRKLRPATLAELETIRSTMPDRYRATVDLACWCSLRLGEILGLQRADVDLRAGVVRVRRSVARTRSGTEVKVPKSWAGVRDVTIPAHVIPGLREHIRQHALPGKDGLVFPSVAGGLLSDSVLRENYLRARAAAGRPDLRFHDLRHTGQTYAAQAGANLRELMARAGQSTPGAALGYLHEVDGRQREIADRLSAFAAAGQAQPL